MARSLARYGTVGRVRDIVPKRMGVSGRVVELDVVWLISDVMNGLMALPNLIGLVVLIILLCRLPRSAT